MRKTLCIEEAVAKIPDGASLMIGGFMAVGTPVRLIDELVRQDKKDLTVIANETAKRRSPEVSRPASASTDPARDCAWASICNQGDDMDSLHDMRAHPLVGPRFGRPDLDGLHFAHGGSADALLRGPVRHGDPHQRHRAADHRAAR